VSAPFGIREADPDADAGLIAEWLHRPHLAASWEDDWPVERWHAHLQAQCEGTYSRPLIAELNGVPVGYLEIYRSAKDEIAGCYDADPHDIGMHGAIAEPALLGKGSAARLLPRLLASVFELDPECRRIVFEPDYRNAAMRRLSLFAKGVFLGEHQARADRRIALYVIARTEHDMPAWPLPPEA
jgi:RimJ/RimL family protein N-acetyltransferase